MLHNIKSDPITTAVDLPAMIENPPAGSIYLQITPEIAAEMLAYNDRNRPLTKNVVTRYAEEMAAGQWEYTRVPIIFSDKGRLIDGQHRLTACVESGAIIETDVAFGAPDEAFAFIDIGKTRTAGDIFAINGVQDSSTIAAAIKWVYKYNELKALNNGGLRLSNAELYEYYLQHKGLHDSTKFASKANKTKIVAPSLITALHYLCAGKSRSQADAFYSLLCDGLGATGRFDPAFVVRNKLLDAAMSGDRMGTNMAAGLMINAWNLHRGGLSARGLRFDPNKAFPRVR